MVNYLVASPDPRIYTISVEIMELVPLLDVLAYSSPEDMKQTYGEYRVRDRP